MTPFHRLPKWLALLAVLAAPAYGAAPIDVYALPHPLVDEHGTSRRLADWRGRPTIVAMDHSTWSAVCSSTARRLRALQVAADRLGKAVEFVVIGLEPDKDTPESWARYRRERRIEGDNWHFLRASAADTPNLAAGLGVNYRYEYGDLVLDLRILRVGADGRIERALEGYDTDTEEFLR
ncbi:MAG: SCO family protein [Rhodocyclaceae bacterium]|nr:SCO family protein [Rhodocyclaceae bacterium]